MANFAFKRTDGNGILDPAGFRSLILIVAECVFSCTYCTSLTDCSSCAEDTTFTGAYVLPRVPMEHSMILLTINVMNVIPNAVIVLF